MIYLLWLCIINCVKWIAIDLNELTAATKALEKDNEEISLDKNIEKNKDFLLDLHEKTTNDYFHLIMQYEENFDRDNTFIVRYFNAFAINVYLKNKLLKTLVEKVIEKGKERLGFQKILEILQKKRKSFK